MRAEVPLREITTEEIWREVQRLRAELQTHNHLASGNSQTLTGVVSGIVQSSNFISGSSGWQLKPNSAEFVDITVSGYIAVGGAAADVNSHATTITGGKITANTIAIDRLDFTPLSSTGATGEIIATINASAEGIDITADRIAISGATSFSAGYDPTTKVASTAGTYQSAASGARVLIFPDANTGIQVIDDATNDVFKVMVGGTDVGDVIIGNYAGGQGLKYDKSAGTIYYKNLAWSEVVDDDGNKPADNATVGATFGTNISGGGTGTNQVGNNSYITTISGNVITTGTLNASLCNVTNINASNISTGTLSANRIASGSIESSKLGTTVISGGKIVTNLLTASNIQTGTLNASVVSVTNINASNINTGTLTGIQINTAASGQRIILYSTLMSFYNSSGQNVASIYAGANDLLITNQITTKNIWIAGGSSGNVALVVGSTIKMVVESTEIEMRDDVRPNVTDTYDLGSSARKWRHLYLSGDLKMPINVGDVEGDLIPTVDSNYDVGSSTLKWYRMYRDYEYACPLPTSNSAIDIVKKIKAPKVFKGKYGERHYFKDTDFPEEMKAHAGERDKETGKPLDNKQEIEMTATTGIVVQAVRELIEKVEALEKKIT